MERKISGIWFPSKFIMAQKNCLKRLTIKIEDKSGQVIFQGDLHNFEKLNPRQLNSTSEEDLYFMITVPYELDNKFQGLNCEFKLNFYVEGTLGGILPANGPKLPETGTAMFNFLVTGGVLVIIGILFQGYVWVKRKSNNVIT